MAASVCQAYSKSIPEEIKLQTCLNPKLDRNDLQQKTIWNYFDFYQDVRLVLHSFNCIQLSKQNQALITNFLTHPKTSLQSDQVHIRTAQ